MFGSVKRQDISATAASVWPYLALNMQELYVVHLLRDGKVRAMSARVHVDTHAQLGVYDAMDWKRENVCLCNHPGQWVGLILLTKTVTKYDYEDKGGSILKHR